MARSKKKSFSPVLAALCITTALLLPLGSWGYLRLREDRMLRELDSRIRHMGELTTVTQRYRSVLYLREKKNFIQDKSLLFTVDFHVSAGVDLADGFELSRTKGKTVLTLAPGRIFFVDGDDSSIRQVFVKERFSTVNTGDYLPLIGDEGESIRKAALDSGILEKAEHKASLVLMSILNSAGLENPEIRFRGELP